MTDQKIATEITGDVSPLIHGEQPPIAPMPISPKIKGLSDLEMGAIVYEFGGQAAFEEWQVTSLLDELRRRLSAQARKDVANQIANTFPSLQAHETQDDE